MKDTREQLDEVREHSESSQKRATEALEEMARLSAARVVARAEDDSRRLADDTRRTADDGRRAVDDMRRAEDDERRAAEEQPPA